MPPVSPPPIALTSLKIRDFRGIESLYLDFRGPDGLPNNLVVLAGPNGSGKTAVLEAALIAVGGYKLATGPYDKRAIRREAEYFEIRATIRPRSDLLSHDYEVAVTSRNEPPGMKRDLPLWYFSSWRT